MIKLERDRYGNDGSVVRARTTHYCEGYRCNQRAINAGEFYYRAVAFPGSEVVEKGNPPWVMKLCRDCLNDPMLERFDAAVASLLPSVTRDNGTVYTPRTIRAVLIGPEDDAPEAVMVLGTHDVDRARTVAAEEARRYWLEMGDNDYPRLGDHKTTWMRRDIVSFDSIDGPYYNFTLDREHGAAAIEFTIRWEIDAPSDPAETPLEGIES